MNIEVWVSIHSPQCAGKDAKGEQAHPHYEIQQECDEGRILGMPECSLYVMRCHKMSSDHVKTLTQPSHPLGGYGDPHNVTLPLSNVTLALPLFTTSLWHAEYPSFITLPWINNVRA